MAELVRVAALTGYLEAMRGFGIDPRPLLKEQGLGAELLANPEQLIPARAAARLLERSAAAAECLTLGLRMAEGRALANLGAASLLIVHQPSLRLALEALGEYRSRINSTLVLQIEEHDDLAILRDVAVADLAQIQPIYAGGAGPWSSGSTFKMVAAGWVAPSSGPMTWTIP